MSTTKIVARELAFMASICALAAVAAISLAMPVQANLGNC